MFDEVATERESSAARQSIAGGAEKGHGSKAVGKVHALESDGVAKHLFPFLLKMQHDLRRSHQHTQSVGSLVPPMPDTIVYDNNFPQAWYVFDRKGCEMVKMPGKRLDAQEIYNGFCSVERSSGGICAQFTAVVRDVATGVVSAETTYLFPIELHNWVFQKDGSGRREGVLQKFIPPRGESNDTLQVTWSPHLCTMTRRANVHRINSQHVPPRDRACTFDGPPHLSIETKGNATVRETINALLKGVSSHLLEGEHRIVSRFVGLFKHDADGNLWMLHMSSIRIQNVNLLDLNARSPVEINPQYIQPDSPCSNEMIARVSKLRVTLEGPSVFRDCKVYVRPNASVLHQHSSPLPQKDKDEVLRKAALVSRDRGGTLPAEFAALTEFIEDTLYQLYDGRMAVMGGGPRGAPLPSIQSTSPREMLIPPPSEPVVVSLSRKLQEFLGDVRVAGLTLNCLKLLPMEVSGEGAILLHTTPETHARTLAEVRAECDLLLEELRRSLEQQSGGSAHH